MKSVPAQGNRGEAEKSPESTGKMQSKQLTYNRTGPRKVSTGIKAEAHFSGSGIVTRRLHQQQTRKK